MSISRIIIEAQEDARTLRKALEDFITCIDAVGIQYLRDEEPEGIEWYDLELAYYHARKATGKPFDHLGEI